MKKIIVNATIAALLGVMLFSALIYLEYGISGMKKQCEESNGIFTIKNEHVYGGIFAKVTCER